MTTVALLCLSLLPPAPVQAKGLRFRVVDARSGAPLAGATVERRASSWQPRILLPPCRFWLHDGGRRTTDADGLAVVENVAWDDRYYFKAEGYDAAVVTRGWLGFKFTPDSNDPPRRVVERSGAIVVPLWPGRPQQQQPEANRAEAGRPARQWPSLIALCNLAMLRPLVGDKYITDEPPAAAHEAAKWWAAKIDSLAPDLLAVLCSASEIQRQSGTTATCINYFCGYTMAGPNHYELRLPLPLPDVVVAKARARLAGWAPAAEQPDYRPGRSRWYCQGGESCSDARAQEIWQEAERACGWRR